jgi:acyl-CoA reductase-like NAD-dependent aldehyde dehydrogenase
MQIRMGTRLFSCLTNRGHAHVADRLGLRLVRQELLDANALTKRSRASRCLRWNQGEVCMCPSRVLIDEKIYDLFMERALKRVAAIQQGHPLDKKTMIGAQVSQVQLEKILSYVDLGKQEGAECLIGGERNTLGGELSNGCYVKPTVFRGHNNMRIFQEEIFGPVGFP